VGVTGISVPLVAAILPGVMTPVPPVKYPVRLLVEPASIWVGVAVKLVIFAALTVTVALASALVPPDPVQVSE